MKKLVVGVVAVLAVLMLGSSAGATNGGPLDCFPGCRINILRGTPTAYPAGQPFVIFHSVSNGGGIPPQAIGMDAFKLEVDGAPRAPDVVIRDAVPPPDLVDFGLPFPILENLYFFNFPNGMTGTHTFTGHWFESCANAVADGSIPGPCANPATQVEFITKSLTVAFT